MPRSEFKQINQSFYILHVSIAIHIDHKLSASLTFMCGLTNRRDFCITFPKLCQGVSAPCQLFMIYIGLNCIWNLFKAPQMQITQLGISKTFLWESFFYLDRCGMLLLLFFGCIIILLKAKKKKMSPWLNPCSEIKSTWPTQWNYRKLLQQVNP